MRSRRADRDAKVIPPIVRSFRSPGGRLFKLGPGTEETGRWGVERRWPIFYRGKPAGQLNYGYPHTDRFSATTRELYWRFASDAPTGIGFDVAAFDSPQEALRAWGRSADQILDWYAGKPMITPWSKGVQRRKKTSSRARRRS